MDVADLEAGVEVGSGGEVAGDADRGFAEVDAGHVRTRPSPRQGVQSEVALKMEQRAACDRAQFVGLEVAEPTRALEESRHVVQVAPGMDRNPLVPHGAIGLEMFRIHRLPKVPVTLGDVETSG